MNYISIIIPRCHIPKGPAATSWIFGSSRSPYGVRVSRTLPVPRCQCCRSCAITGRRPRLPWWSMLDHGGNGRCWQQKIVPGIRGENTSWYLPLYLISVRCWWIFEMLPVVVQWQTVHFLQPGRGKAVASWIFVDAVEFYLNGVWCIQSLQVKNVLKSCKFAASLTQDGCWSATGSQNVSLDLPLVRRKRIQDSVEGRIVENLQETPYL